jgi:hypothetical protein
MISKNQQLFGPVSRRRALLKLFLNKNGMVVSMDEAKSEY